MDIFQRAADLFDRAQDRMNNVTNQAARVVLTAAQIRTLEVRQAELRVQLETATMELGKLTFQRWKSRGLGNEQAMTALCEHIDALNAEYQQVLGALASARMAGPPPPPYPSRPVTTMPIGSYPPLTGSLPPPPALLPAAPLPPPLLPRSLKPARECPECYSVVPGSTDFCPSCGMRV